MRFPLKRSQLHCGVPKHSLLKRNPVSFSSPSRDPRSYTKAKGKCVKGRRSYVKGKARRSYAQLKDSLPNRKLRNRARKGLGESRRSFGL